MRAAGEDSVTADADSGKLLKPRVLPLAMANQHRSRPRSWSQQTAVERQRQQSGQRLGRCAAFGRIPTMLSCDSYKHCWGKLRRQTGNALNRALCSPSSPSRVRHRLCASSSTCNLELSISAAALKAARRVAGTIAPDPRITVPSGFAYRYVTAICASNPAGEEDRPAEAAPASNLISAFFLLGHWSRLTGIPDRALNSFAPR